MELPFKGRMTQKLGCGSMWQSVVLLFRITGLSVLRSVRYCLQVIQDRSLRHCHDFITVLDLLLFYNIYGKAGPSCKDLPFQLFPRGRKIHPQNIYTMVFTYSVRGWILFS